MRSRSILPRRRPVTAFRSSTRSRSSSLPRLSLKISSSRICSPTRGFRSSSTKRPPTGRRDVISKRWDRTSRQSQRWARSRSASGRSSKSPARWRWARKSSSSMNPRPRSVSRKRRPCSKSWAASSARGRRSSTSRIFSTRCSSFATSLSFFETVSCMARARSRMSPTMISSD